MSYFQSCCEPRRSAIFRIALLFLPVPFLLAQSLRITSPPDGTVVHPGDSLKVKVEASGTFLEVMVISGAPIGFSKPLLAPPYEWTIQIPDRLKISPGLYPLAADGATSPGHGVSSETITISVEPGDPHLRLRVQPTTLSLAAGGKGYLRVFGVFPDGQNMDLTPSQQVSFTSDAPAIASVDPTRGIVSAITAGSAKIIVKYRDLSLEVPVIVLAKQP